MINTNEKIIYGVMKREGQLPIHIVAANCLCAMTYRTPNKELHLFNFYLDEAHIKRIIKNNGSMLLEPDYEISLNLYYKEANILLKYFVREGFKVECYYKKPEK